MSGSRIPGREALWAILALALTIRLLTAWPMRQPGYTDAYYYAVGAGQLRAGAGLSEPFIWNYLDPPEGVRHPGYNYWMPLTAMLGWLGLESLGDSFRALQAPFVLLSALLPLVAYSVAWDLTGQRRHATLAALLAIFPGFYAHVFVLPDNFAPFALAGSICLWAAGRGVRDRRMGWFGVAGLAAGFAHLARADGMLLAGIVLLAAACVHGEPGARRTPGPDIQARHTAGQLGTILAGVALAVAGYSIVMGPWFLRNWQTHGALLGGGGLQTLFLTSYDDMFAYGRPLTLQGYLDWGWTAILASKGKALLLNLQRLWVENLLIFLLPFSAMGLWRLRRERMIWPFLLYLPLLFVAMTAAFTFPGTRGGLFHSGSALLPFLFAAAGPGLETLLSKAARRLRGWHARKAWPVFSAGLVGLAILVTVLALWRAGVLSGDWNGRKQEYGTVGNWLAAQEDGEVVVMVGDAPAFTWHTGHPAITIPNETLSTIVEVADRYGARYLVLDDTRTRTTDDIYEGETTHPRLELRFTVGAGDQPSLLYEIVP